MIREAVVVRAGIADVLIHQTARYNTILAIGFEGVDKI